ncbi:redoxin domain-containing protein [Pedobacter sp. LMG 31464]|uniref:Redoxin domain-containing protein n=1 Tax=Pedobacter planticolens TaxID=2679964 RepID=A0A923DVD1_9SPHI|nr:thioredoxin family protein [Pedobacter planticolens]MBB2144621.1 redoxin domain-containing protein [Pedobacter planticolens]
MKHLLFIALVAISSTIPWETSFEVAKKNSADQHKLILLNFSGSDWCGPCIRMHSEIFADQAFLKMANANLILINADFPRNKKNQPLTAVKKQNESLADKYNPQGKFPFTLILNSNGKVIKTYDGLPDQTAAEFTNELKKICDANK